MKFELWIIRVCIKAMWRNHRPVNILRMAYNKQIDLLIKEGDLKDRRDINRDDNLQL